MRARTWGHGAWAPPAARWETHSMDPLQQLELWAGHPTGTLRSGAACEGMTLVCQLEVHGGRVGHGSQVLADNPGPSMMEWAAE